MLDDDDPLTALGMPASPAGAGPAAGGGARRNSIGQTLFAGLLHQTSPEGGDADAVGGGPRGRVDSLTAMLEQIEEMGEGFVGMNVQPGASADGRSRSLSGASSGSPVPSTRRPSLLPPVVQQVARRRSIAREQMAAMQQQMAQLQQRVGVPTSSALAPAPPSASESAASVPTSPGTPGTSPGVSPRSDGGVAVSRRWTPEEDEALRAAVVANGESSWKTIAAGVQGRTHVQCFHRWTQALKPGVVKGVWSAEEDGKLLQLKRLGGMNWRQLAKLVPGRSTKQCRERWQNFLDPALNKSKWTPSEDVGLLLLHAEIGNKWAELAQCFPGRTKLNVRDRWRTLQKPAHAGAQRRKSELRAAGQTFESSGGHT